jgi:hypothetical protein
MPLTKKLKQGIIFIIVGLVYAIIGDIYEQLKTFLGGQLLKLPFTPSDLIFLIIGIVGVALITLDMLGNPKERQMVRTPTKERAFWLSNLVRLRRKEGVPKAEFWTIIIAVEVILPFAIYTFLNLLFILPLTLEARLFGIITVGAMIFLMTFFALLAVNELYTEWTLRKQLIIQRNTAYQNALETFDRSFEALQEATQPKTKEIRLDDFENCLRNLCNNFSWDTEVSRRITDVVKYIPLMLVDDLLANRYVFFLNIIINSYGRYAIPMIKERFLTDFEKMYNSPKFETNFQVLYILMELHGYSEDCMMRIVDDAAYRWSDNRFQAFGSDLDMAFSRMSKRDPENYRKFFKWLDAKMQDAERNNEGKAQNRLETLRVHASKHTLTTDKGVAL